MRQYDKAVQEPQHPFQYDGDVLSNIIDKVFIYNDKDIEIVFKGENFIRNAV